MRLCSLWLKEFGVLRRFSASFAPEESHDTTDNNLHFLVGLNGSGKSSVLRAIAMIFDQLDRKGDVDFPFEIVYRLSSGTLVTIAKPSEKSPPSVQIGDDPQTIIFSVSYLPERIIAFTTGREDGWLRPVSEMDRPLSSRERALLVENDRFLQEMPRRRGRSVSGEAKTNGRVHLIRSSRLPLVFLCGYLADWSEGSGQLDGVLADARVQGLAGFSLRVRSDWSTLHRDDVAILGHLWEAASHRVQDGAETVLVFDLESATQRKTLDLLQLHPGGMPLFLALDRLAESDLESHEPVLLEVNLFVRRKPFGTQSEEGNEALPLHLFDWLSDGEKDFLGRMALFTMLKGTEALLLVDEPEVHFNDFWKRQIVHLLSQSLSRTDSHALVATHSSITLSDVRQKSVRVLRRGPQYTTDSDEPSIQTFAADPGDILVYVFGAPFRTGKQVEAEIASVVNDPALTPEQRADKLRDLADEVAPGYWSYRMRDYVNPPEVRHAPPDDASNGR